MRLNRSLQLPQILKHFIFFLSFFFYFRYFGFIRLILIYLSISTIVYIYKEISHNDWMTQAQLTSNCGCNCKSMKFVFLDTRHPNILAHAKEMKKFVQLICLFVCFHFFNLSYKKCITPIRRNIHIHLTLAHKILHHVENDKLNIIRRNTLIAMTNWLIH